MVAELGQDRDGDRADAAGGARDHHRAAIGRDAVPLQRHDAEHRRIARGADRHGVVRRHAVGQRHQPVAIDAGAFGKCAEMRFADAPAIEDDLVALLPVRDGRRK